MEKFIQKNGWDVIELSSKESPLNTLERVWELRGIVVIKNQPITRRYYRLDNPIMRELTGILDKDQYDTVDPSVFDIIYKECKYKK